MREHILTGFLCAKVSICIRGKWKRRAVNVMPRKKNLEEKAKSLEFRRVESKKIIK